MIAHRLLRKTKPNLLLLSTVMGAWTIFACSLSMGSLAISKIFCMLRNRPIRYNPSLLNTIIRKRELLLQGSLRGILTMLSAQEAIFLMYLSKRFYLISFAISRNFSCLAVLKSENKAPSTQVSLPCACSII